MSDFSLAPYPHEARNLNLGQKAGLALASIGVLILIISIFNIHLSSQIIEFTSSVLFISIGVIFYTIQTYRNKPLGIHNDGVWFSGLMNRGMLGWSIGVILTAFYILLYWYPEYLGLVSDGDNKGIIGLFDPLSKFITGNPASEWFMYGTLYTLAILVMGFKFIYKYWHNKYHVLRTISVMFFQLGFAYLIPEILVRLNKPYYDFKNMWPLDYDFFFDWQLNTFLNSGKLGIFMLIWGILMIIVISPVLTYFYGKRWYCSWVCGCGGLAETAGDPFRQLSDKSIKAWKIERVLIHSILVFAVFMTLLVLYTFFTGQSQVLFMDSYQVRSWYGFLIGAIFSGVIGVGFYPILGSRVWCRYGCPMAAILGIQQRFFSRFRITTNGGQCISCGNCSTYCEMGIDVRSYAQKGQDIVRASCVGCGVCAAVCPRGVLRLENGPDINHRAVEERVLHITSDGVQFNN